MGKHSFEAKKFRVKEGDPVKLSQISTKAGSELSKKADGIEALKVEPARAASVGVSEFIGRKMGNLR